jgi:hypothetical protein
MARMSEAEADAYRRSVLEALGEDDPLEVQETEVAAWRALIDRAGPDLRTRPGEGQWSVLECLGHMADSELVTSARYRWILAEDQPALQPFDQEAWAARLGHYREDPATLLDLFASLRRANVALWERTPPADRDRVGLHAERGRESFELLFRMQAGHGRVHRAQAERALAEARRKGERPAAR